MKSGAPQEDTCQGISFYRSRHARIRELKRQHSPSSFGFRVWGSCWLLMDYLKTLAIPIGSRVMDVGCGWGLAGIFCASKLGAEVVCVDSDPEVFHYLRLHAELNRVKVATLTKRFENLTSRDMERVDLLIGADICFWDEIPERLLSMMERALASGVSQIIIADPGRSSFEDLAASCQKNHACRLFTISTRKPHFIAGRILVVTNSSAPSQARSSTGWSGKTDCSNFCVANHGNHSAEHVCPPAPDGATQELASPPLVLSEM